ncbi:hypothetical protein GLOTRDRAFT_102061 [Gloeophyllum trabeum ATCC 11539]|uniref:tRNA (guanine(37)-N1)-methyltransferase n=1 Tax=Gloeophyllum trabeum (strain ATCC 11539 / FP-39264 / Madison 617) TaxID=670483 RepID=S7QKG1_GLOTA|nr:uncharacterized protein GLOTRDRAFT_102061 [Gloeophyllum trabeum ATCC 11539]EPQ60251.1 hypothetical protein GLOTRDRAFT_102061 [Gloeophyllum trabeum ATCC 11539]
MTGMRRRSELDASPPVHRGMKDTLDKSVFRKTLPVLAARVPSPKAGLFLKSEALRRSIINLPKIRSVVPDPSDSKDTRLVLFRVSENADLPPEAQDFLREQSADILRYNLDLNYDYWTADEILHSVLPEELCEGAPSGFAITGHIAHVNLNDEYLPYKHVIGQVILDKNKAVRTVVNKLNSIDTKFRFFKMELLAGEPDYVVEHHESDCRFIFDFTKVYWNSRLHTEHDRLVQLFKPEDVVADVFAGVGPFAIPAAKKGCAVVANDLNPDSYLYLKKNIELNHVSTVVRAYCEDGREFIKAAVPRALNEPFPPYKNPKENKSRNRHKSSSNVPVPVPAPELPPRKRISHFVMNLPDTAIEFLDAFRGIMSDSANEEGTRDLSGIYDVMPMVHCHCFTRELEPDKAEKDIRARVQHRLGYTFTGSDEVSLHLVRSVAPNKDMYCISFRLPREVAFA